GAQVAVPGCQVAPVRAERQTERVPFVVAKGAALLPRLQLPNADTPPTPGGQEPVVRTDRQAMDVTDQTGKHAILGRLQGVPDVEFPVPISASEHAAVGREGGRFEPLKGKR